jgi:hypothetical protein
VAALLLLTAVSIFFFLSHSLKHNFLKVFFFFFFLFLDACLMALGAPRQKSGPGQCCVHATTQLLAGGWSRAKWIVILTRWPQHRMMYNL